jgi:hypothetical protein
VAEQEEFVEVAMRLLIRDLESEVATRLWEKLNLTELRRKKVEALKVNDRSRTWLRNFCREHGLRMMRACGRGQALGATSAVIIRRFKSNFSKSWRTWTRQRLSNFSARCGITTGRLTEARAIRVKVVVSMGEAYAQTTTFGLCGRAFDTCGLVPWCPERVLANPDVRDCLRDGELDEISARSTLLHAGSSVLTSNEFKARRAKHIAELATGGRERI